MQLALCLATGFVIIDKKTSNMALVMDWTTTTCMAMGYLFFCNYCVCKCNNTILSDSRTPNIHTKYSTKAFGGTPIPWFNASPLPSKLQHKNWKPNHTQISNNTQNAQICKTKHPPKPIFLVPHKLLYAPMFGLKFGSRLSHWKLHLPTSTQYGHEFILRLLCGILPYQYV
jgi:hypothetical protein